MKGLKQIRSRIEEACRKSGRSPSDVTLIAVAKSQPIEKIREAIQAGVIDIGENYAQELLEHVGALLAAPLLHPHNPPVSPLTLRGDEKVCWHFIGHLQRNKVRQIIDRVELIHSVDSFQLAREINKQARKIGKGQKILLEINLGGEGSKTGLPYSPALFDLISEINRLDSLRLRGLMVIPPFSDDPEGSRPFFRKLREIRDEINSRKLHKNELTGLSMGMTDDLEIAVEEGATMVRVGTGIFGPRLPLLE